MKNLLAIFILLLVIYNCSSPKKSNTEEQPMDNIKAKKEAPIKKKKQLVRKEEYQENKWEEVEWSNEDIHMFSDSITKSFAFNSIFKEHIEMSMLKNDEFSIAVSNGLEDWYNRPLQVGNNIHTILRSGFTLTDTIVFGDRYLYRLEFKKSFLYLSKDKVAYSYIVDSDVSLNFGLRIGMTKNDFFKKIMDGKSEKYFSQIKKFELGEILGEMSQVYYFKDQKLVGVVAEIFDHWMIEEIGVDKNVRF